MTYNPKIKNTSNTDMSIDANIDANNITMGDAEDGVWTDGIFAFTNDTKVGTAIDKINELLKGLAPKIPSDLDNISTTAAGTNVRFAKSNYTMEALSGRAVVERLGPYVKEPATNYQRLAAYKTAPSSITLTLNGDKSADTANSRTNYPADSFRVARDKKSTFKVYVNDDVQRMIVIDTDDAVSNLATFTDMVDSQQVIDAYTKITLSATSDGLFTSTGEPFTLFQNRTGNIVITKELFVIGFNKIRVTHTIEGEQEQQTNYVEFVVDGVDGVDGTTLLQDLPATLTLNKGDLSTSDTIKDGTPKYLSGIKYYPGGANCFYNLEGTIGTFASDFYSNEANGGIKKATSSPAIQGGAILTVAHTFSNIEYDGTKGIDFASNIYHSEEGANPIKVQVPASSRILDASPNVSIALRDVFSNAERGSAAYDYGENIMLDSVAPNSTDKVEDFNDEAKRIEVLNPSPWSSNGDVFDESAIASWDSTQQLAVTDLGVQGGALKPVNQLVICSSPTQDNPLPSVTNQDAVYYRRFDWGSPIATGYFKITLNNITPSDLSANTSFLKSEGVDMDIELLNGVNQWKSLLKTSTNGGSRQGTPSLVGQVCTYNFNLGTGTSNSKGTILMKIKMPQNFAGSIEKIELTQ